MNNEFNNNFSKGGDAGEVFIAARKIIGNGIFSAEGGDGIIGGKGGKITLISDDNQFTGKISVEGGKSFSNLKNKWYKSWLMLYVIYPFVVFILGTIFLKYFKIIN